MKITLPIFFALNIVFVALNIDKAMDGSMIATIAVCVNCFAAGVVLSSIIIKD